MVDADNIRQVLECTCRLHNYCIDQRCAEDNFVPPLEDFWWQRTASPRVMASGRAPLAPVAVIEPQWAAAADVSAAVGAAPVHRNQRERAVRAVEASGLVAPDASGTWTRAAMRQKRLRAAGNDMNAWRV